MIQRKTQAWCGLLPIPGRNPEVWAIEGADWGSIRGTVLCGSPWACPVCAPRIREVRARELQALVKWHGPDRAALLTFTVRHGLGDDLKVVRAGVARAWRRFTMGEPWKRFAAAVGLVGHVRAGEVTHGWVNGWHPHLHVLLLVEQPAELAARIEWLTARWQAAVVDELGEAHVPDVEHGVKLTAARDGSYLSKMGTAALELTDAAHAKQAKNGNRDPWSIAMAATAYLRGEHDDARDVDLWRDYCVGMLGARALTWSRGLKEAAGIEAVIDAEAAKREGEGGGQVMLAEIPRRDWPLVCEAVDGENWVIHAAVRGGQAAVDELLRVWRRQERCGERLVAPEARARRRAAS